MNATMYVLRSLVPRRLNHTLITPNRGVELPVKDVSLLNPTAVRQGRRTAAKPLEVVPQSATVARDALDVLRPDIHLVAPTVLFEGAAVG